jgi:multisubunit Na+/H+ antiporter MnhG subunit
MTIWNDDTHPGAEKARKGVVRTGRDFYERVVAAAAAATFLAAFAAFAAVDALRRLFVFGGVAGASPISSAVIMLVTNSFGP